MRVLMFGWEFPPHISGGLGTACHGLAHALVEDGVDVLFVVPKLSGEEISAAVKMISASEISFPKFTETPARMVGLKSDSNSVRKTGVQVQLNQEIADVRRGEPTRVLSPYNSSTYGDEKFDVQRWNYQFATTHIPVDFESEESDEIIQSTIFPPAAGEAENRHKFSGTYGHDLMYEVGLYAQIASVIAKQNEHDVIHVHDWISFPAGIAAKKESGKPLIAHIHATEFDRSGENINPQVYDLERAGMIAADKILTVSQWTRQIVVNRYGISPEKVEVVYNGIVAKPNPVTPDLPPSGSHVVTFLGRITHQKGPYYFVEAAKLVLEKFPDAHFVVAGAGDLLPAMIEHVAELKISSRFHFTGFVKGGNLNRIWSVTNVYVMPSVSEPFGLTPLEAIQSGVPVIISRQSGVSEVMHHAIKINFWDVRQLASAICSVLQYKGLAAELKKNSEKEIETINWNHSARKINHLYHELTNQRDEYKNSNFVFSDPPTKAAASV